MNDAMDGRVIADNVESSGDLWRPMYEQTYSVIHVPLDGEVADEGFGCVGRRSVDAVPMVVTDLAIAAPAALNIVAAAIEELAC